MPKISRPVVIVSVAVATAAAGVGLVVLPRVGAPTLTLSADGPLSVERLQEARASIDADGKHVKLEMHGKTVAEAADGELDVALSTLGTLKDGEHTLTAIVRRGFPLSDARSSVTFTVDTTAPTITLDELPTAGIKDTVTVTGKVTGGKIDLTGDVGTLTLDSDGTFSVRYDTPPTSQELLAVDAAGNTSTAIVDVPVVHPGMRAVHMSALSWTSKTLREPIFELARQGKIDTIQLDIKDENGEIGYKSNHPLANEIGAVKGYYDAEKAIAELHEMGLHVVGRIVAFRDPIFAPWAFRNGKKSWTIQTAGGQLYTGKYGGFGNPASPEARQYNIDLAVEAAKFGFDDILYDYIRRPDGELSKYKFDGLGDMTIEQAVALFCKESREALRPLGVYLGASVYGIAADRPTQIGQDIPAMSEHLDYVAPMVYPSHWAPGEYGVANPNSQPYDIVHKSLAIFQKQTAATGTKVIPWLQDFSLGVTYGPAEVRAQIKAGADLGIPDFIMWNAGVRYTASAL